LYPHAPAAPTCPSEGFPIAAHGPITLVRYRPAIAYDTCRDEHGPVAVPIRVEPHPRRYGDGTITRPPTLPRRITCMLAPGSGGVRVVAAVTSGAVVLRDADGRVAEPGAVGTLCVRRGDAAVPIVVEVATPAGAASDLDLYERPDTACAGKIAP
jgi:hypothetical protein